MKEFFYLITNTMFLSKVTPLTQTIFWLSLAIIVVTMLEIFKYYLYKISEERTKEKVLKMFKRKNTLQEFVINNQTLKKVPEHFIKEQNKFLNIYDNCSFFAELRDNGTIHIIAKDKYEKTIYNNTVNDYKYFATIFIPKGENSR